MRWRATCLVFAAGIACGNIAGPPASLAPVNSCSTSCPGDAGAAAVCAAGTCLASAGISSTWTAVVTLSQDAIYAPGVTFAVPLLLLLTAPPPPSIVSACQAGCAALPEVVSLKGNVLVSPSAAIDAKWYLGNVGALTTLPVQATFWPQVASGTSFVDATAFGLPVGPIALANGQDPTLGLAAGPGGGPSLFFSASALAPAVYQSVLQPLPPFDEAYPPDVSLVDLRALGGGGVAENVSIGGMPDFDRTFVVLDDPSPYPTFDFSRADGGSLEGWTAWIRDQTTQRRISNLARLHGSGTIGDQRVQLLTRHNAGEALTNAQLVLSPDASSSLPTWIFTPISEIAEAEAYPRLPPAVTASGSVGVPADIVFEATGMCRFESNGTLVLDAPLSTPDFSFSRQVTTTTGAYSVQLPLGQYKVTVVPRDASTALHFQTGFDLSDGKCQPRTTPLISLTPRRTITSTPITVADGRPLAGATVEVVPTECATLAADPTCLPRPAQTITAADGSYSLSLDPGAYKLRVKPVEGTRFPWVVQPLSVDPSTTMAPPTVVPAPVYVGLQLVDPFAANPMQGAVVRVYQTPTTGGLPFEIGAAITDGNGHFDMYLAPSAQ